LLKTLHSIRLKLFERFPGSTAYWEKRYAAGGNSGRGSYDDLASFKAEVLNAFLRENQIISIIEFGCGDGSQLSLLDVRQYLGLDVSQSAIKLCEKRYGSDPAKTFKLINDYAGEKADLSLSLDVIYHLVEDEIFHQHMHMLFDAAEKYVIIYSSNTDDLSLAHAKHIRHRRFSDWIETLRPEWELAEFKPNKYSYNSQTQTGSFADFYIYKKS
jgi:protein O-GlcNAc transferase